MSEMEIIREIIIKNIKEEILGLNNFEKVLILDALRNDIATLRIKFESEILKLENNGKTNEKESV
jgi:hypothetical protein